MLSTLSGHVALVTGASSGIGRAVALRLAKEGADLCLTARREELLEEVAEECRALGVEAFVVPADASVPENMPPVADKAVERFGKLSILVNVAGVLCLTNDPHTQYVQAAMVNMVSLMVLTQHCIQYLTKNDRGAIIQISSVAALNSYKDFLPYCGTKHGVRGFSQGLFNIPELRLSGVKVCTIHPGLVETPMSAKLPVEDPSKMISPEDIAECVAFVAMFSDRACPTEITVWPQYPPGGFPTS